MESSVLTLIRMVLETETIDEKRWYLIRLIAEMARRDIRLEAAAALAAVDPELRSCVQPVLDEHEKWMQAPELMDERDNLN